MSNYEAPLKVGDRVSALHDAGGNGAIFGPAVVHAVDRISDQWYADLRMVHGLERVSVTSETVISEEDAKRKPSLRSYTWDVHWHRLSQEGWKPPERERSPQYLDSIEGMPRSKRTFFSYPGKVESWTTCGLDNIGRGTVFADPQAHDRHLVFLYKERAQKHWSQVVSMKIFARNAVTGGGVEPLLVRSNESALVRTDSYFATGDASE